MNRSHSNPQRGASAIVVLFILVVVMILTGLFLTRKRWESQPPEVTFSRDFKALGKLPALSAVVQDKGTGLKHVTIRIKQKDQDVVLADESLTKTPSKSYDIGSLIGQNYKIQDGPASLTITATDDSLRNFLHGNKTDATKDFVFATQPPRLEVLEGQHYINQGGSECVVYRVSDNTDRSGVRVGSHFFPGFPVNGSTDKGLRFALFALEYDWPADTPIEVVASDAAGNEVKAGFWHKVFPKNFRSRDIPLEDSFVNKVVPEILSHTPEIKDQGDTVKTFVEINSNLRRKDHETIAKLTSQSSGGFLWNGAFLQLSNSKVESFFADRRTYVYKGQKVDRQDHVGFDLSTVSHDPIEASNDGKVVLAEYFGIYGNTVLIDHGAGLMSLYGHMSEIQVKPGQMVKKKEILGKSGTTGLAAGDHLHFGLFLQGVPVNPTEWWDEKWIRDHVLNRLPAVTADAQKGRGV
jgi:murein DD-endopeptidase MepM/ murein hydrolase activator NlpD